MIVINALLASQLEEEIAFLRLLLWTSSLARRKWRRGALLDVSLLLCISRRRGSPAGLVRRLWRRGALLDGHLASLHLSQLLLGHSGNSSLGQQARRERHRLSTYPC